MSNHSLLLPDMYPSVRRTPAFLAANITLMFWWTLEIVYLLLVPQDFLIASLFVCNLIFIISIRTNYIQSKSLRQNAPLEFKASLQQLLFLRVVLDHSLFHFVDMEVLDSTETLLLHWGHSTSRRGSHFVNWTTWNVLYPSFSLFIRLSHNSNGNMPFFHQLQPARKVVLTSPHTWSFWSLLSLKQSLCRRVIVIVSYQHFCLSPFKPQYLGEKKSKGEFIKTNAVYVVWSVFKLKTYIASSSSLCNKTSSYVSKGRQAIFWRCPHWASILQWMMHIWHNVSCSQICRKQQSSLPIFTEPSNH